MGAYSPGSVPVAAGRRSRFSAIALTATMMLDADMLRAARAGSTSPGSGNAFSFRIGESRIGSTLVKPPTAPTTSAVLSPKLEAKIERAFCCLMLRAERP